jgi:triosephosphate isomerase
MIKLRVPIIIINFKTYTQATGKNAIRLSRIAEEVSKESGINVAVVPQFTDLVKVAETVSIPVFSQHIDAIAPGSFTGHVLLEAVKEAGAVGTLINHSERTLKLCDIEALIAKTRDSGLFSVVCTNNAAVSVAVSTFKPDIISLEPPELIGTGIPVSKAKPQVVTEAVKRVKSINPNAVLLCGAGITKGEDVTAALNLGTMGVLVASGIVKAKCPKEVLMEFAEAITNSTN